MDVTPFTFEGLPPLGVTVRLAQNFEKPNGEKFARGGEAVVAEHRLAEDGRVYVGARTADGRVFRSLCREAFDGLPSPMP